MTDCEVRPKDNVLPIADNKIRLESGISIMRCDRNPTECYVSVMRFSVAGLHHRVVLVRHHRTLEQDGIGGVVSDWLRND